MDAVQEFLLHFIPDDIADQNKCPLQLAILILSIALVGSKPWLRLLLQHLSNAITKWADNAGEQSRIGGRERLMGISNELVQWRARVVE